MSSETPANLSVLELAAQRGIGPLSELGQSVWHGQSMPCVSCGQLVDREVTECDRCGQDLCADMLQKMSAHAGPWYVQEHVRPFPGVSLERLIRQIRRGVLTQTTVVRGPTTYHQWRFAAETPVLSKYLGCCWVCQSKVLETDASCSTCQVELDGGLAEQIDSPFRSSGGASADPRHRPSADSAALRQLSAAVRAVPGSPSRSAVGGTVRIAGLPLNWVLVILFVLTFVGVLATVSLRTGSRRPTPAPSSATTVAPATPDLAPPIGAAVEPTLGSP